MILFTFTTLIISFILAFNYLKKWKDERPDLGGFGGKKDV